MTLAPGARLGAHEIIALIGAGGMGEVYRARDTRLHRDVAIKVLPEMFSGDTERLARFKREAHILASLNHPNIASIYGVEDSPTGPADGPASGPAKAGHYVLILELVDGATLADRIAQGAMPLDEALPIARQIADALEAAHDHGIIHRDLKPANIKITRDGQVKVLDFGLAKAAESANVPHDVSTSPTITSPATTHQGLVLGSAAYMSPEQARGKAVDKRSDIWAFGCVLYEMLVGKRVFEGDEISDVIAFVITREPNWAALPSSVPEPIRRLLHRCLEKDRRKRLADIADARLELEDITSPANRSPREHIPANRRRPWIQALPWAVAVLAILSAGFLLMRATSSESAPAPLFARVNGELGAEVSLVTSQGAGAILSPDGSTLAFVGQPVVGSAPRLYVRRLDQLTAQPLSGTDGAMNPFFSPDGSWIGFFSGAKLRKIAVAGGVVITLADAPNGRGGSWGDDDYVVYMPDFYVGLWRVSSSGGTPVQLTTPPDGGGTDRWPQVLPGSKGVLFTRHTSTTGYENALIVVQPLPGGEPRVIQRGGYHGRYVSSGHLIYVQGGALFAASFDLNRLERTSEPVPVVQDVANGAFWTGAAQFSASDTGAAVYASGSNSALPIEWLDVSGNSSLLRSEAANWADPSFAPDGRRLAVDISDGKQSDIWIHDLERQRTSRLTVHPSDELKAVWTLDNSRVAYASSREGSLQVFTQRVDGTGEVQRLTTVGPAVPTSWHPSGKFLAVTQLNAKTSFDVVVVRLEGDDQTGLRPDSQTMLVSSAAGEIEGVFSPDGRWLAYASNESGRFEVYVRPFPGAGGPWQISAGGGTLPTWSRARQELIYGTLDQRLMAVSYTTTGGSFDAASPRVWSEKRYEVFGPVINRHFDLHPDGKRVALAMLREGEGSRAGKVVFAFNFFDELRKAVASRR